MIARLADGSTAAVALDWSADELAVEVGEQRVTASLHRFDNGERDAALTLERAAAELASRGVELIGCLGCARFQFSGMSRQMSAGTAGYCLLAGFRRIDSTVRIDWRCGEHATARRPIDGRVNAFRGAMLGLAIGDALGFPAELRSASEIAAALGDAGVTDFVAANDPRWNDQRGALIDHPPGSFSDDTQMSLAVAGALIEAGDADLDVLMRAMSERFVAWSRSPDNDRVPGSTCMTGCERLAAGTPWKIAGVADSKGAGAPMRAVPIGLRYWRERDRLLEVARASAAPTHRHITAVESTAAVALAVARALDKQSPARIREELLDELGGRAPELAARLSLVDELSDAPPAVALSAGGLGEGWVAEEAVAAALWCWSQSPANFDRAVLLAANATGDSDTIATITGGLAGAFNGADAIRADWRERVERAGVLTDTADELWRSRSR